jgi:hypothetical protein
MTGSKSRYFFRTLVAVAIAGFAASARAQDVDALRKKFMLTVPEIAVSNAAVAQATSDFFRGAPGTNSSSPSAFGPNWGEAFVGGAYQSETRGLRLANGTFAPNGERDGSVSAGFGIGNSASAIGIEVVVTSLSTVHSGFFNRTAFSFQVNRMLGRTAALAVGVENAVIAGGEKTDGTDSWYGVVSKVISFRKSNEPGLFRAFTLSVGGGNGRFRAIDDVAADKKTVNGFASGSVLLHDQVSAIVDYTGQDVNVGLSIVPLKAFPLVFTPTMADVTSRATATARFLLGVGIAMHF